MNKNYILLFTLVIATLPYCYLSFFTNPSSDDFSLSAQAQQYDFFELVYEKYLLRNGRYISSPLTYLNPIVFGSFFGYKVISLLLIIVVFLSGLSFINQLIYQTSKSNKLIGGVLFLLLFLQNMPVISESIYWYTGSVIYTLGAVLFLSYISFFMKIFREGRKNLFLILLTFLLFLTCGFNEVLTLFIVFSLAVITFVFYQRNLARRRAVLLQFLFGVLFALVLFFSPGNEIRGSKYVEVHQLLYSLGYSFLQVSRFAFLWIASVPLFIISILYVRINSSLIKENNILRNSFYLNRWASLLLLFSIIFICVFPAYWATGMLGQHRTLNVAYFFFIIMWFVNLTVWYNYYQNKIAQINITTNRKNGLMVTLLLGLIFTGNSYHALNDIFSGAANSYNIEQMDRFKRLSKANKQKRGKLVLLPLNAQPECLFTSDITNDSKDWRNHAYNMYFRLDSVEIYLK